MIALLQRVTAARVEVEGKVVGAIERGIVALIGVERGDGEREAERLVQRVLGYRMFPDRDGRMNLCIAEVGGGLLLVPQFTLAADTTKGTRASFTPAAAPEDGRRLYEHLLGLARARHPRVESGSFGADMQVHLVNDGPVTFRLQVAPPAAPAAGR
jgi:D-tyrosyl-tRNA(Tyr) deacylase